MAIARTAITTTAAQVTSTAGTYLLQAQSSGPVFVYVAASTPTALDTSPRFVLDNREFVTVRLDDSEAIYVSGDHGGFIAALTSA